MAQQAHPSPPPIRIRKVPQALKLLTAVRRRPSARKPPTPATINLTPSTAPLTRPLADLPDVEARTATRPLPRRVTARQGGSVWALAAAPAPSETLPLDARKARKPWTAWRIVRWLALTLVVALLGYVGWIAAAFAKLQDDIYQPRPPTFTPNPVWVVGTSTALSVAGITVTPTPDPYENLPKGRINILMLGSDKRPDALGISPRSDTLILVNLDTVTRRVSMLTIPRDLAVEIPGYPGKQKINAAYFLGEQENGPGGGPALAAETVSRLFNVPVEYYVMINFEGFRTLVDTLGGIDVDVPEEIDDYRYPSENPNDPFAEIHIHFDAGRQHMDGKQALRYARTRHADNDFGRSRRQLQVILALKEKATSIDLLPRIPGLLDQLGGMIETDVPPDKQLPLLQAGYDLNPSRILTASIGADLVTPVRLPDRSEALNLNMRKAKPVLDQFFGREAKATPTKTPATTTRSRPTLTPTPRKQTANSTATPRPTARPRRR